MEALIEIQSTGIFRFVGSPVYGKQDFGYAPGGAADRFSLATGNILLQSPEGAPALEMVLAPGIKFKTACCFILTGGKCSDVVLSETNNNKTVAHGVVYLAPAGSRLVFGKKFYGLRTYLCIRDTTDGGRHLVGTRRGSFSEVAHWPHPQGRIRVVKGPEYEVLVRPEDFISGTWSCAAAMDNMGIRLSGKPVATRNPLGTMISAPVDDGTIQLTPNGPIILLRERQTCGGYPRIFSVISSDIDLLAQYQPFQKIQFAVVSLEAAREIARLRASDLADLKRRFL